MQKLTWNGPFSYSSIGNGQFDLPKWTETKGVYVIAEIENNNLIARYVGQGDIPVRMVAHQRTDERNEDLRNLMQSRTGNVRVYHVGIISEEERNDAEHTSYIHYDKISKLYNIDKPPGNYVGGMNIPF